MGKSTISMAIFNSFLLVHQRVSIEGGSIFSSTFLPCDHGHSRRSQRHFTKSGALIGGVTCRKSNSLVTISPPGDFSQKGIRWCTLWWTNILQWKITIFTMLLMGKSTISTGPCSIAMLVHQRVDIPSGYVKIAIENGHRNSWFTMIYPLNMVIFYSFLHVYQRVSGLCHLRGKGWKRGVGNSSSVCKLDIKGTLGHFSHDMVRRRHFLGREWHVANMDTILWGLQVYPLVMSK